MSDFSVAGRILACKHDEDTLEADKRDGANALTEDTLNKRNAAQNFIFSKVIYYYSITTIIVFLVNRSELLKKKEESYQKYFLKELY